MTNLIINQHNVDTEREVVLEERRMRTDNDPSTILYEQASAAAYLNYPYRRPVIGWEHEIRGLTLDEILAFHKRYYAPNNAILVVAGDITAAELKPLAEKFYGVIPRAEVPERFRPSEPPQKAARELTLSDPRVRQPSWSRSFLAPSYVYGETKHAYPLEVLAEILGGGATSRIYSSVVVEQGLATGAGAWYSPDNLGPARFGFYGSPRPGTDMDAIETAIQAQIDKVLAEGVTDDEVARAKQRLTASAVYARDSLAGGARALGAALASGQTVDDVEAWPERIAAVTREQIEAAAHAVFRPESSVTSRLLRAANPVAEH
jgi:zinc protease